MDFVYLWNSLWVEKMEEIGFKVWVGFFFFFIFLMYGIVLVGIVCLYIYFIYG